MATPEARICNRALARIGQLQQIVDIEQTNVIARACKVHWDDAVNETLEAHDWPFARRRAPLGAIEDGERGGFGYAYTLPADFIAARFIEPAVDTSDFDDDSVLVDPTGVLSGARPVPFELEDDDELGTVLLTDQAEAQLVYTARVVAVPRWSANFRFALSLKMAAELALSVAKRPALSEALEKKFEVYLARAARLVSKHRKPRPRPQSIFERNR